MATKLFILAGNSQQAKDCARLYGLNWNKSMYLNQPMQLMGCSRETKFVRYGTYFEHPDYSDIMHKIRMRGMEDITDDLVRLRYRND